MQRLLNFSFLIGIILFFVNSCKYDNSLETHKEAIGVIYVKKYDINTSDDIPEQFTNNLKYKIDTLKYKLSKPLGEYKFSYKKVFTDSILHTWNRISMENIKKTDPKLLKNGNYVKYQFLKTGDNYRTEFWRMMNCFYSSLYDFDKGFYVVETFNSSSDPHYNAIFLISPQTGNKTISYQFRFGTWTNSDLMAYLKDIIEIDYNAFYSNFVELKKQNIYDELIWGLSELTVSYFYGDTIESYVNIEYGNFEIISKIEKLLERTIEFSK